MAFKVLDLFSGAGGLSRGFYDAGYDIVLGVDFDEAALKTFKENHGGAEAMKLDLFDHSNIDVIIKFLEEKDIKLDVLVGGPPCQGFSVAGPRGYMFNFGPTVEEESFQIYYLLKYISENVANPVYSFHSIYRHSKWQDNVKEFNDRVVLVLINNVNDYLTRVGIDMGLDENTTWNVSGGQVNVASGNAVINATQNNGVEMSEMENLIKQIMDSVYSLEKEDAETIVDSIEMIRDELQKPEPKGKIISNGIKLLAPMISIANGIPTLADHIQKFIDMVTPYIH